MRLSEELVPKGGSLLLPFFFFLTTLRYDFLVADDCEDMTASKAFYGKPVILSSRSTLILQTPNPSRPFIWLIGSLTGWWSFWEFAEAEFTLFCFIIFVLAIGASTFLFEPLQVFSITNWDWLFWDWVGEGSFGINCKGWSELFLLLLATDFPPIEERTERIGGTGGNTASSSLFSTMISCSFSWISCSFSKF